MVEYCPAWSESLRPHTEWSSRPGPEPSSRGWCCLHMVLRTPSGACQKRRRTHSLGGTADAGSIWQAHWVEVAGTLSEWFPVKKGVRQGCVLSPYLLNILAEIVMRQTMDRFQGGLQIGGWMITNLRYTDDIILLATSEAELQELVDRLDRVSRRYSLLNKYSSISTRPR